MHEVAHSLPMMSALCLVLPGFLMLKDSCRHICLEVLSCGTCSGTSSNTYMQSSRQTAVSSISISISSSSCSSSSAQMAFEHSAVYA
jgi:hypothetical protein